jgi:ribonuclease-3
LKRLRKATALETALGYKFKSRDLLDLALTHASVGATRGPRADNERLEFLGDRVLGLAIAQLLLEMFPSATEGELAKRFNRLVRGETCAEIARRLDLGASLILSESEAATGGRDKETILADAMEAVLGAVFEEAGFEAARSLVRAHWSASLDPQARTSGDPKSMLQEWAQGQGLALPVYREVARSGPDHKPHFVSEVEISGRKPAVGEGPSKRAAEQSAARSLLVREGVLEARGS